MSICKWCFLNKFKARYLESYRKCKDVVCCQPSSRADVKHMKYISRPYFLAVALHKAKIVQEQNEGNLQKMSVTHVLSIKGIRTERTGHYRFILHRNSYGKSISTGVIWMWRDGVVSPYSSSNTTVWIPMYYPYLKRETRICRQIFKICMPQFWYKREKDA